MSKAEDLSRQYVLPFLDEIYEVYGEHRQMQLSKFDGYDMMSAYEEGYHQAEKDLELSWDDIHTIVIIEDKLIHELCIKDDTLPQTKEFYQEVLKRFKYLKNENQEL